MTIETTIHHPSSNLILLAQEHALAKAYCLDSKESQAAQFLKQEI